MITMYTVAGFFIQGIFTSSIDMLIFLITSITSFVFYLLLTTASGDLFLWSREELITGAIIALIVGLLSRNMFFKKNLRMLNPKRWFIFTAYMVTTWIPALVKANIDVAYRVITGRINPGIFHISPKLKTDLATTMLALSINLTPGTLTVDINEENNDLYIHWINVDPEFLKTKPRDYHAVANTFPDWLRRIAD